VIVAHSNEAEWQKFKADHTNEAILDRIVVVKVPYNLRLSEEVKIYEKFLGRSKFKARIAPHTLEIASMFAVLSRLEPTPKCDLLTKLKLYNGEEVLEKGGPRSSPPTSCATTRSARACSASAPAS
jgi:serine protein kinase